MDSFLNSTTPRVVMAEPALTSVNGVLKGRMVYALATVVLATILMSAFQSGRKSLLRIVWFLDSLAGETSSHRESL